MLLTEVLPS